MSKHTKWPWEYDREDGEYTMWIKGADGSEVLSGCGCCGSPNLGIDDARLIAAAPELLEALEDAVDILILLKAETIGDENDRKSRISTAEWVIAKARGEV